ncbi:AhpC/TSA family protein [Flammeovirgaceae bacterium SG7u.111]|nr:AhpC/TSA family protein [Flammeovirgaceae bacterium SG7u.132]WPO35748.1 AhpC/TSA family protein [Flammeovirgaceae bacterium SG7u.111]
MKTLTSTYVKILLALSIVGLLFTSCEEKKVEDGEITLSGEVLNAGEGGEVTLSKIVDMAPLEVSKVKLEGGKFSIPIQAGPNDFYVLNIDNKQERMMILGEKDVTLVADGGENDGKFEVKGSADTEVLLAYNKLQEELESEVQGLQTRYQNASLDERTAIEAEYDSFQASSIARIKGFIEHNSSSLATVIPAMSLSIDDDSEFLGLLADRLFESYPENALVIKLKNDISAAANTAIGKEAPEIKLENPNGEMVALSSLRGKYVLIDFWAAWCGPCRHENPNVVKLYAEYKDKGFEIFGVSLDKTKEDWVKAIEDDNLGWVHVSDLKFWNSSVVPKYNITGIPMTYLLDKEGKIIAKGLRGKQLEDKLAELM